VLILWTSALGYFQTLSNYCVCLSISSIGILVTVFVANLLELPLFVWHRGIALVTEARSISHSVCLLTYHVILRFVAILC